MKQAMLLSTIFLSTVCVDQKTKTQMLKDVMMSKQALVISSMLSGVVGTILTLQLPYLVSLHRIRHGRRVYNTIPDRGGIAEYLTDAYECNTLFLQAIRRRAHDVSPKEKYVIKEWRRRDDVDVRQAAHILEKIKYNTDCLLEYCESIGYPPVTFLFYERDEDGYIEKIVIKERV